MFFADAVVVIHCRDAVGIGMPAKAADKSVDRVKSSVAEKAQPQLEIARAAVGRIDAATCFFPEPTAPEGGFLLDIAIGASKEAGTGPTRNVEDDRCFAALIETGGSSGDPFDLGEIAEDASDDGKTGSVELVRGADPAHNFASCARKSLVNCIVHAVVRFTNPAGDFVFIFSNDLKASVCRIAVNDEVIEIGIGLRKDRTDRFFQIPNRIPNRGHKSNAWPDGLSLLCVVNHFVMTLLFQRRYIHISSR